MGGMYKLNVIGYIVATVGRLGVMVAGYMGNIPLMLAFTAIATLGIAPLQGDLNALIASCSEHTTMKTGHRLDGMMYSCSSLGIKIGGLLVQQSAAGFLTLQATLKMLLFRHRQLSACFSSYICGHRQFFV